MSYPSIISVLANPAPTDRLSSPSHSTLHDDENTGIVELQTFVGTLASTAGTLIYDIRSPNSNGGGHVQTAVLGGTGQITYTKGDMLAAQSGSVLGKLAVGADNQVLVANSSVASGVNWAQSPGGRLTVVGSIVSLRTASTAETSLFSVIVPGSTLGTSNAIRSRSYVQFQSLGNGASIMATINYGGGPVASVILVPLTNTASVYGTLEAVVIANGNTAVQRAILTLQAASEHKPSQNQSSVFFAMNTKAAAVNSSANQVFGVTLRPIVAGTDFDVNGTIVERIN